jgi:ubiquinone biosynthesis protein
MLSPNRIKGIFKVFRLLQQTYRHDRDGGKLDPQRGIKLRQQLEKLGPIFIKFGQILSIRADILPADVIAALTALQDQTTPFPGEQAQQIIESQLQQPIAAVFDDFDLKPLASASIAQVHTARLKTNGAEIIIKVVRPNIETIIRRDIKALYFVARQVQRWATFGKQLRPQELVAEFETTILNELDMQREAANASKLKRNFADSNIMYVPQVHWDYTRSSILVMERIHGTRISDIETLKASGTNMATLAKNGVEIFFTQVLRDRFFHADMHPGNLFIDHQNPQQPRYLGVDFGIIGTLTETDQNYIGKNFLAIFQRDYRKVAELHIEAGWVPADTRIDQFEAAIRTIAEPVFEKPISDISFGELFLKLIQVARNFNMQMQPQLLLLQKTLMSIESLGKQLYPELDLWTTAQPLLEKWFKEQYHPKKLLQSITANWQGNTLNLLQLPQKIDRFITQQTRNNSTNSKQSKPFNTISAIGLILCASGILLPPLHHVISGTIIALSGLALTWIGMQKNH